MNRGFEKGFFLIRNKIETLHFGRFLYNGIQPLWCSFRFKQYGKREARIVRGPRQSWKPRKRSAITPSWGRVTEVYNIAHSYTFHSHVIEIYIANNKNDDLCHASNCVELKLAKVLVISKPNAVIDPFAVMVHAENTFVAFPAVVRSREFDILTPEAILNHLHPF